MSETPLRKGFIEATDNGFKIWTANEDGSDPSVVTEVDYGSTDYVGISSDDYSGESIDMEAVPVFIEALQRLKAGWDKARQDLPAAHWPARYDRVINGQLHRLPLYPDPRDARIAELEAVLRDDDDYIWALREALIDAKAHLYGIRGEARASALSLIDRIDAILNKGSDTNG